MVKQAAHHDSGEDAEEGAEANDDAVADALTQRRFSAEEACAVVILYAGKYVVTSA